ncbi:MAG TPA: tetratricopeptide repeat protein, partial [Nitrospiraceae bacterium]
EPRQPQTFFTTGHLLQTVATVMKQDRDVLELAVKQYRSALEVNPEAWWATQNLGLAYATLGRWNDALGAYQTALTKTPDDAVVLVEMGQAYQHLKETTLAISSYQAAIQKDPCLVRAHTDLGLIYLEDGKWDEAVTAFSRASRCQPTLPDAAYHWGLALEKKGSVAGALQVWEDFLLESEPVSDSEKDYVDQMRARVAMLRASMASGVPNPSSALDISAAPSNEPSRTTPTH